MSKIVKEYVIEAKLLEAIMNYLCKKPYVEVIGILSELEKKIIEQNEIHD